MHGEKKGCTQMIKTFWPVWWRRLTCVQTTNPVESDKCLGGLSSIVGVLNEGTMNSSWEDQRVHGRGGI